MIRPFLFKDHHQALNIWKDKGIKDLDLVHLDAHIDFGFYQARPPKQIIEEAKTLKELKRELEKTLLYQGYQKDFDKQTNIGNYIYPAMQEGIVKNFWWVIPGGLKEFKKSIKSIKRIIKGFSKEDPYQSDCRSSLNYRLEEGIVSAKLLGRGFFICALEKLPLLKRKALLDIDVDFLTTSSLLDTNNTSNIKRKIPWIYPDRLVEILKESIENPEIITIAYSVNGGYAPIIHKFLGDDIRYRFSNKLSHKENNFLLKRYKVDNIHQWQDLLKDVLKYEGFKPEFKDRFLADINFNLFNLANRKGYYLKAVKLDPSYRVEDNNYGPVYLAINKFSKAQKEFSKILKVDPKNPYSLAGLGRIALIRRKYLQAKKNFSRAFKINKALPEAVLGLAEVEFRLKNFEKAKRLLLRYQKAHPLTSKSYYFLGRIYERRKDYPKAACFYQDCLRLGGSELDAIKRLLRISLFLKRKDLRKFIIGRYKDFEKGFRKRQSLEKKIKGLALEKLEGQMEALKKKLC